MENIIKLAVVNFHSLWGDVETNLKRLVDYAEEASNQGVNLILFPETCLTGYDNDKENLYNKKMHYKCAQTIQGEAVSKLAEIAKKHSMYIVFGLSERDLDDETVIYNSAAVIKPNGEALSYRKIHLPFDEKEWAIAGEAPLLVDSEWGKFGVSICYDTYCFPELMRYYRANGARLILNLTACPDIPATMNAATLSLKAYSCINYVFIASSNLCGKDKRSNFKGGSCVIGSDKLQGWKTYIGHYFGEQSADKEGMFVGKIDLSDADNNTEIPIFNGDWKKGLYKKWL